MVSLYIVAEISDHNYDWGFNPESKLMKLRNLFWIQLICFHIIKWHGAGGRRYSENRPLLRLSSLYTRYVYII